MGDPLSFYVLNGIAFRFGFQLLCRSMFGKRMNRLEMGTSGLVRFKRHLGGKKQQFWGIVSDFQYFSKIAERNNLREERLILFTVSEFLFCHVRVDMTEQNSSYHGIQEAKKECLDWWAFSFSLFPFIYLGPSTFGVVPPYSRQFLPPHPLANPFQKTSHRCIQRCVLLTSDTSLSSQVVYKDQQSQ